MNIESANLVLRTASVAVGADKDSNRSNIWFRGINMRVLLGQMYEKYDSFKICLTSVGNTNTTNIANVSDRVMCLNMSGLQWMNQTYDVATKTNKDYVVISTLIFQSTTGFSQNYTGEIGWVFTKPLQDTIDINLYLTRVSDGSVASGINYGESVFCFSVYGI